MVVGVANKDNHPVLVSLRRALGFEPSLADPPSPEKPGSPVPKTVDMELAKARSAKMRPRAEPLSMLFFTEIEKKNRFTIGL